jgi:transposase InsO family protein
MESIYFDVRNPGSFSGAHNLQRYSNKSRRSVQNFLSAQDAYTMHKQTRVRFARRRTYSKGLNDVFQADLVDLSSLSSHNDGMRYLLTCIDVFSKYAWCIPLKTKSGREVRAAFECILADRPCTMLQTDKGTEWLNSQMQSLLSDRGIKFYTSENEDIKAAVVERFNRTIKSKMWRYFTYKHTRRYLDVLDDLVYSYNNTYHRSIGMRPSEVDASTEQQVRERLYPPKPKTFTWKYDVGDHVRISMHREPFQKGYTGNWSEELFVIATRHPTVPVTYGLQDLSGEDIKGKFYELELQKVIKTDAVYIVEKILKTRKRAGKIEYYVKWRSYPDKFNSWVDNVDTVLH